MRIFLIALVIGSAASAAITAPPLADAPVRNSPGLKLTMIAGGKGDTRTARLVSLYVSKGQPVSPFLPAGPFTATWEGSVMSDLRAEYTIAADVRGAFKLSLNGQLILEGAGDASAQTMNKVVQLSKGANKLVAEFVSDGQQDASLQLKWWTKEFPPEPVPPMTFQHNISDAALRQGERVREGRLLFAQHRCAVCHDGTGIVPPRGEGMPELQQTAPIFGEMGARFEENFLAHWINDPHSIRPHSLMPRVFADGAKDQVDQRAADLAAFLVSIGQKDDTAPAAENAPLGGALFANLGCIACHTPPDFEGEDEHQRVALSHVKAKWQPKALRDYLKDPARDYPHTRMPNFRLTDEEAERLTSYLIENAKKEFPPAPKGSAEKGGQLLVSAGCISCHAGAPVPGLPKLAETLTSGWSKGCLAVNTAARGKAPDFSFTAAQRDALQAFGASGFDSLKQDSPIEFAERQLENLRCAACHSRDSQQSVWSQLENEMMALQSVVPNSDAPAETDPKPSTALPPLTWTGEKLQPGWMEQFIAGQIAYKPRNWIIGRMPAFVPWAKGIAEGLALEHGFFLKLEPVKVDKSIATIGERLIGENGGFNCVQCHSVGPRGATAVFEAPGIDLAYSRERLRAEYYIRWVLHPLRIDPETKMPRFSDDEGKTPLTDVLGGRAAEQFDAIWQYLHTVERTSK